ncbi:MAG: hypothetical protein ACNA8W_23750, partial [Bradymonadaceae bacterium]
DTEAKTLTVNDAAPELCLVTPPWASIDAGHYDELVLRLDPASETTRTAVYWAAQSEEFSAGRAVVFERSPESGEEFVIPLGTHAGWQGTVTRLRILPIQGSATARTAALGAVFFQSSSSRAAGSKTEEYIDTPPVALIGDGDVPEPDDEPDDEDWNNPPGGDGPGGDPPGGDEPDGPDGPQAPGADEPGGTTTATTSSCQVVDIPATPVPATVILVLLICVGASRLRLRGCGFAVAALLRSAVAGVGSG